MDTATCTTTASLPDHDMDDSGQSVDQAGICHWASPLDWDSEFCVPEINNPAIKQAILAPGAGPEYLALVNQACTISGPTLDGVNTMVPRSFIHREQTSAPVISVTPQELVFRPHYGNKVHSEQAQDEQACTHDRGGPKTNNPGWDKWKPEIENLYMRQRLTLPVVVAAMKEKGFSATESMYKRKFKAWGWTKYVKNNTQSDSRSCTDTRAYNSFLRESSASTNMTNERSVTRSSSQRSTVRVHLPLNSSIPKATIQTERDKYLSHIYNYATSLYLSSFSQRKWKVENHRAIQEDEYDDLLTAIASSLADLKTLSTEVGILGLKRAFRMLDKVVGDCGLFTLPAIWDAYLRLLRKGRPDIARRLLAEALRLARQKFPPDHPLLRVLIWLRRVELADPDMLEDIILGVFRQCINHVRNTLTMSHRTTLQLWVDYLVYQDNSSANDITEILNHLQRELQQSEEENGEEDDFTLDILSLKLTLLQSTESLAGLAEHAARDMFSRANRRKDSGERLEGSLFDFWKDSNHTLAVFALNRGDLQTAVQYMNQSIIYGIKDARDIYTLQRLQDLYTQSNDPVNADSIRTLRTTATYALLRDDVQ